MQENKNQLTKVVNVQNAIVNQINYMMARGQAGAGSSPGPISVIPPPLPNISMEMAPPPLMGSPTSTPGWASQLSEQRKTYLAFVILSGVVR